MQFKKHQNALSFLDTVIQTRSLLRHLRKASRSSQLVPVMDLPSDCKHEFISSLCQTSSLLQNYVFPPKYFVATLFEIT